MDVNITHAPVATNVKLHVEVKCGDSSKFLDIHLPHVLSNDTINITIYE